MSYLNHNQQRRLALRQDLRALNYRSRDTYTFYRSDSHRHRGQVRRKPLLTRRNWIDVGMAIVMMFLVGVAFAAFSVYLNK